MADTHIDNLKITVSGTPGTGTITQAAAVSGCRALVAGDAGITISIRITDGTAWETATGCAVADSGGGVMTITRGTFQDSSTGSALSLTSAAVVECSPVANLGNRMESAALSHVAITDANVTMAVGNLYAGSIAGFTADRTYTLPATAAVGDRVGIMLTAGDDTYGLLITAASGDTLNGVAGGTEWSRVFITNEVVIMRCVTANSGWVVEQDGRIPMSSMMIMTTPTDGTEAAATYYRPATDQGGAWTTQFNVGDIAVPTSDAFKARRACRAVLSAAAYPKNSISDTKYINVIVSKTPGTPTLELYARNFASVASFTGAIVTGALQFSAGEDIYYMYRNEEANKGLTTASATSNTVFYSFSEIL